MDKMDKEWTRKNAMIDALGVLKSYYAAKKRANEMESPIIRTGSDLIGDPIVMVNPEYLKGRMPNEKVNALVISAYRMGMEEGAKPRKKTRAKRKPAVTSVPGETTENE